MAESIEVKKKGTMFATVERDAVRGERCRRALPSLISELPMAMPSNGTGPHCVVHYVCSAPPVGAREAEEKTRGERQFHFLTFIVMAALVNVHLGVYQVRTTADGISC